MLKLRVIAHTIALCVLISIADILLLLALLLKPFSEGLSWRMASDTA